MGGRGGGGREGGGCDGVGSECECGYISSLSLLG